MFPEIHAGVYGQRSSQLLSPHTCFSGGGMPDFTSCLAVRRANHSAAAARQETWNLLGHWRSSFSCPTLQRTEEGAHHGPLYSHVYSLLLT